MKKLLYSIMVALFAVVATSCSTQMGELSSDYVSCNPSPLVAKGGKVDATVSINFPAKFFPKKATLTVTPVLVAANGAEQKGERGEKGERRDRKGGKARSRSLKESAGYEDDAEEGMYNPFAEAFKGTEWENQQ